MIFRLQWQTKQNKIIGIFNISTMGKLVFLILVKLERINNVHLIALEYRQIFLVHYNTTGSKHWHDECCELLSTLIMLNNVIFL